MRTRTKIIPSSYGEGDAMTYDQLNGLSSAHVPSEPPKLIQRITDVEDRPHLFNYVKNVKTRLAVQGIVFPFGGETTRAYTECVRRELDQLSTFYVPSVIPSYSALQSWPEMYRPADGRQAYRFNYPSWALAKWDGPKVSLNRGFSLINFLLEWRESVDLIKAWGSPHVLAERWHALLGKHQTLGGRAKAAANERLMHVYGTRLFIRDAYTLWHTLTKWKDRADRFLDQSGVVQKSYKRPVNIGVPLVNLGTRPCPVFGVSPSSSTMEMSVNMSWHACLAYSYSTPALKSFFSRLAQLSDSLGIQLDAGIVWDAVTLSFSVDWFINISQWLHANASLGSWVKAEVTLLEFCHSAKVVETRTLSWNRPWYPLELGGDLTTRASEILWAESTWYLRERADKPPVFDKTNLDLTADPWRVERVINALALVTQRAKIPGKRLKPSPPVKPPKKVRTFWWLT